MEKIVVGALLGGIGNQMFQYAAAKALALHHSAELFLDLRGFDRYPSHNGYELDRVFGIYVRKATTKQLRANFGLCGTPLALKLLRRPMFSALRPKALVIEPSLQYWDRLREIPMPFYMMGYWQSEKYFSEITQSLREIFRFRLPLSAFNSGIAEEISSCRSVAIHIRRGDYISHKKTSQIMSVCSMEYYKRAINFIENLFKEPVFYIFSDDPDWATTHFKFLDRKTIISHNKSENSYVDMQLMSYCKHQIIANSTFSWWGAWLNPDPEKTVIAPRKWFCNGFDDGELIPPRWIRL